MSRYEAPWRKRERCATRTLAVGRKQIPTGKSLTRATFAEHYRDICLVYRRAEHLDVAATGLSEINGAALPTLYGLGMGGKMTLHHPR